MTFNIFVTYLGSNSNHFYTLSIHGMSHAVCYGFHNTLAVIITTDECMNHLCAILEWQTYEIWNMFLILSNNYMQKRETEREKSNEKGRDERMITSAKDGIPSTSASVFDVCGIAHNLDL